MMIGQQRMAMESMRIYLDTSVPSTYFDARTPERQEATQKFWLKAIAEDELFISDMVLLEISNTPSLEKKEKMLDLVRNLTKVGSRTGCLLVGRATRRGKSGAGSED